MREHRRTRAAVLVTALLLSVVAVAGPTDAQTPKSATALRAKDRIDVAKGATTRSAVSDPALLASKSSKVVSVVVKLDHDAAATYRGGGAAKLRATSPLVTGRPLSGTSAAERSYDAYQASRERAFAAALAKLVPSARLGRSLRVVYGGVTVRLPENRAKDLLSISGVVAVQQDTLRQPLTDSSNEFIGSPTIWSQVGGQELAGAGLRFASIDTGIWPEHPSFAANPALPPRPTRGDGTEIPCTFGDNPLTPEVDVFGCNNKLIGGGPFLDTYNAVIGGEVYPDSARDSGGHGTHTASTSAGDVVGSAPIFGIERGPISGVAPGAEVLAYKVCGVGGCFSSDSAAAVGEAILDGASVINFSISGGTNPATDPVELAFLDAYSAGVFVAASAGNDGPAAGTVNHQSPWVTSVAASTQLRDFETILTLADGASSTNLVGSSLTHGVSTPTPIVLATDLGDALCEGPFTPGQFDGKVVACQRGTIGRVQKGANVLDGGAVGMILYNLPLQETETDNHFLPAVHLADGTDFLAFMAAHPGALASWPDGVKGTAQGDVMAAFSSRGPGGSFIKPDITAPGVQILAGNSPTPDEVASGPAGEYFQAIAGTSMSSPHIAGSALLVKALHPTWTPGQVKSALMTTALQSVVKEDLTTPADAFDFGSGRVDLTKAGDPGLTFDETADRYAQLSFDPITAPQLNVPSIDASVMPGEITVTRTATNSGTTTRKWSVHLTQPASGTISVSPRSFRLAPGESAELTITISAPTGPSGQYFGQVTLVPTSGNALHLPVAFNRTPGDVALAQKCAPSILAINGTSTCTIKATNLGTVDTTADFTSTIEGSVHLVSASGATVTGPNTVELVGAPLSGVQAGVPSVAYGPSPFGGYLDLADFGVAPVAVGDESIVNFDVPEFSYASATYTQIGVTSNGYAVAGGGDSSDVDFVPQTLPDPAKPNNVLAPFWSDLDGGGADGVYAATLTDGVSSWVVIDWHVFVFGTTTLEKFELVIGINGVEDITFGYDAGVTAPDPANGLTVGAENFVGTGGGQLALAPGTVPTDSVVVTSAPGAPGGTASYTVTIKGETVGPGRIETRMTTPVVPGTTVTRKVVRVR